MTLYWVGISVNFDQFEPVRRGGDERREGPAEPLEDNVLSVINTWEPIEATWVFFVREALRTGMAE